MKTLGWLDFALGIVLMFVGFTIAATTGGVMATEIVLGLTIAGLAAWFVNKQRPAIAWVIALAGLCTLVAPAFMHGTMSMTATTNIVIGVLVMAFAVLAAVFRHPPVHGDV